MLNCHEFLSEILYLLPDTDLQYPNLQMKPDSDGLSGLPVFFIVGRGRSGSTLLRSCFDAHPNVAIPAESRFVQYLFYRYHHIKKWTPELAMKAISDAGKDFEPLGLDHRKVFELVKKHHHNLSFQIVCKIIYLSASATAGNKDIVCIGDKNPRYTFFISQLIRIFPDAKFIHLIRDYRANALTITKAARDIGEIRSVPVAIARWKYYNSIIDKMKKKFPRRFYTLRYEDLVIEPEKILRNLCKFVGLEFNAAMLNYEGRLDSYFHDPSFSKLHQSLKKPFNTSKVSEWQKKLSRHDIMICETMAAGYGKKYGYQPSMTLSTIERTACSIVYSPLALTGKVRFMLKRYFYHCPFLMRIFYSIIIRLK